MRTNDVFQRLEDLRSIYHYKVCISLEDGKKLSPDEIVIEDPTNPDEVGKWKVIQQIYPLLDEAFALVKYYEKPVAGEGWLMKKQNGRYDLVGYELTSGCVIEVLNEEDEPPAWVRTTIEHNGEDYYAVSLRGNLEGMRARYR